MNRYKNSLSDSFVVVTVCSVSLASGGESPLEWRRFGMAALRNGGPEPCFQCLSISVV